MSVEEWAVYERFILSVRAPNGCKLLNRRLALDWIFRIGRTRLSWQYLPEGFGE
jgi:transposase